MNSLNTILDSNRVENDDNEYMQLIHHSSYYNKEIFGNLIHSPKSVLAYSAPISRDLEQNLMN